MMEPKGRTTSAALVPAQGDPFWERVSGCAAPTCSTRQSIGVRGQWRSGKSRRMQMSEFSLSSHPCSMQDESCPNGAHSCYFGGLCRCVPGHPGRENHTQPWLLLPWQLVRRWRKGETAPSEGWAASTRSPGLPHRAGARWREDQELPRL